MAKITAAQMLKEVHPDRVQFPTVKGIFKEGVQNRYEKNLQRWFLNHSTEIIIDGVLIGENDIFDSSKAKTIETNRTDLNGIPLTENTFIEKELKQSRQIFDKTLGSELNYDIHEETKAYIEYLENRKKELGGIYSSSASRIIKGINAKMGKSTKINLFNQLIEGGFIDCSEADFLAMFTDTPKPIKWVDTSVTHPTNPNKQTIFELFYLLSEFKYVVLPDLEKGNKANLFRVLEFLFPDIQNFPNSSGYGKSLQKTQRQRELKAIIENL